MAACDNTVSLDTPTRITAQLQGDGSSYNGNILVSWNSVPGADNYDVGYQTDTDYYSLYICRSDLDATSFIHNFGYKQGVNSITYHVKAKSSGVFRSKESDWAASNIVYVGEFVFINTPK